MTLLTATTYSIARRGRNFAKQQKEVLTTWLTRAICISGGTIKHRSQHTNVYTDSTMCMTYFLITLIVRAKKKEKKYSEKKVLFISMIVIQLSITLIKRRGRNSACFLFLESTLQ